MMAAKAKSLSIKAGVSPAMNRDIMLESDGAEAVSSWLKTAVQETIASHIGHYQFS